MPKNQRPPALHKIYIMVVIHIIKIRPLPFKIKGGVPLTLLNALTGELTPPAITCLASLKSLMLCNNSMILNYPLIMLSNWISTCDQVKPS